MVRSDALGATTTFSTRKNLSNPLLVAHRPRAGHVALRSPARPAAANTPAPRTGNSVTRAATASPLQPRQQLVPPPIRPAALVARRDDLRRVHELLHHTPRNLRRLL